MTMKSFNWIGSGCDKFYVFTKPVNNLANSVLTQVLPRLGSSCLGSSRTSFSFDSHERSSLGCVSNRTISFASSGNASGPRSVSSARSTPSATFRHGSATMPNAGTSNMTPRSSEPQNCTKCLVTVSCTTTNGRCDSGVASMLSSEARMSGPTSPSEVVGNSRSLRSFIATSAHVASREVSSTPKSRQQPVLHQSPTCWPAAAKRSS